jgi:hypothetical protein
VEVAIGEDLVDARRQKGEDLVDARRQKAGLWAECAAMDPEADFSLAIDLKATKIIQPVD